MCAVIATSAIFTGCESRDSDMILPENSVFQDYYVKYNVTTKQTEAKATFRTIDNKGVRLVLKGKSSVKLNGKKHDVLTSVAIDGYFYTWKNQKGLLDAKFTYVKNGTKRYNNTFTPKDAPKIEFKSGHEKLDLKKDNTITWKGDPLKLGERLSIVVLQGDKYSKTPAVSIVGATSVVIRKDDLKALKAGKATIRLSRELILNTIKEVDGTANGRVTLETEVVKETIIK